MTTTTIRVFQGTSTVSDDGWANDAFYALDRAGYEPREGVDNCTSWEECSGLEDGDEYVTMRVRDAKAAVERLQALGYRAMPESRPGGVIESLDDAEGYRALGESNTDPGVSDDETVQWAMQATRARVADTATEESRARILRWVREGEARAAG